MVGSTMKSVAKLAGVSVGTVSRVLNNHPNVSRENRLAVESAVKTLNYTPDPVARSLRKLGSAGRIWTGNIGVVFPDTTTAMLKVPFMARMIQGVQGELADNGYHLIISNTTDAENLPDIVLNEKVEGVLIHGDMKPDVCRQLMQRMPAVSMGCNNIHLPLPMVNVNNRLAVISAMRYLSELGHRRIGFVSRELDHKDLAERLMGYRESFDLLGLEYDANLESTLRTQTLPHPRMPQAEPPEMDMLIEPLLNLANPPTALFVTNDWQAVSVYRALQKRGFRIPQDMSVIGFDNDQGVCQSLSPSLTSLDYPAEQIGRTAVQLLLKQFKKEGMPVQETILLQSSLVERASCASRDVP